MARVGGGSGMSVWQRETGALWMGDCLELMADIPDGSIDMILCDLPYGTTACSWDTVIPFEPLWAHYWRVLRANGAIVLTSAQPFTTALNASMLKYFRYEIIWDKINRYTGALHANKRPMRRHENISIFARKQPVYNKQMREGTPYRVKRTGGHGEFAGDADINTTRIGINDGSHNPCSILPIKADVKTEIKGDHPTQKPVALFEYLIKTYTDPGMTVLDNCAGSCTTAIAAMRTGRRWLCIEREPEYVMKSMCRILDEESCR